MTKNIHSWFIEAEDACQNLRALVIGDAVVDTYLFGETSRVSREAPVLIIKKERTEHRLGGAANVAANLSALGVSTTLVCPVGEDAAKSHLETLLTSRAIKASFVETKQVTPQKTRVLAGAQGTMRQQVIRIDDEVSSPFLASEIVSLMHAVKLAAAGAELIVLSDYGMRPVPNELLVYLRQLHDAGKTVCVDSRYATASMRGVTVLTPNLPEAQEATGRLARSDKGAEEVARQLCKETGVRYLLLTRGRDGMLLMPDVGEPFSIGVFGSDEVADVTGAGDTVIAAFGAVLASGGTTKQATVVANLAAGQVVQKLGCATTTWSELAQSAQGYMADFEDLFSNAFFETKLPAKGG